MEMEKLVEVCEPAEVRIEFTLNSKCRTTIQLKSLNPTKSIAFKIQTSSPHKFLVNPPTGLIPPLSISTFQVILKPQSHLPPSYPRSPKDRFLIKTAEFTANSSDNDSINALFASCSYGFSTYDIKLKVAFVGSFLLCDAVSRGDLECVRSLIKRQRSVVLDMSLKESESLLRVATELAHPDDMVHMLLEAGLRVHEAVGFDKFKGSDDVLVVGGNVARDEEKHVEDVEHGKLIFEASRHGNVREVELLLRRGVNLNYRDHYGLTALHAAAFKGHKNVALMLSEVGLDLECEDDEGNVPLHMAVESGDIETVRVFVDKGVNLNAMNKRGVTPLYMARVWGYEDVCQLLVSKGALSTLSLTSA